MSTLEAEDRAAIRGALARLLSDQADESRLRKTMATDSGHDEELWRAIGDMGIVGLLIDPEFGGIGGTIADFESIMELAGAALVAPALLSTGAMAACLLAQSSDADLKGRLLGTIATGQTIAAVAVTGDGGRWTREDVAVSANDSRLHGHASFVVSGNVSTILLVAAKSAKGIAVYEVAPSAPGVSSVVLQTWDPTIRLSRFEFDDVQATQIVGLDWSSIERMLDVARVALAGEQAGACRQIFDITVDYLKTRVQFGRPIGGFQALKHMAADMLIEVESATSAARAAAEALATDDPAARTLISLASFACADAFQEVAETAVQMHGGIAFTWEHPAHLYLRRARANAQLFGSSTYHRDRYVTALEDAA